MVRGRWRRSVIPQKRMEEIKQWSIYSNSYKDAKMIYVPMSNAVVLSRSPSLAGWD